MNGRRDFVEARQRCGNLGQLHQADGALHHARAAGTGNNHQRQFFGDGQLHRASHFFAHHRAHRAADELELHRAADHRPAVEQPFGGDDGVGHAQLAARFLQARGVGPGVREVQRIAGSQRGVMLHPARIEQQLEPLRRAQPEMVLALGADAPVGVEVFLPDHGAAVLALGPQPFGLHPALVGRRGLFDPLFFPLEPGHGVCFAISPR